MIAEFDSSASHTDEMASFRLSEFTLEMLRIGCVEEWSSKELTEFVQLMIVWLIRGSQGDFCVSTMQISAMSREWETMLIEYITGISRAQWADSGCAAFVQLAEFTHFFAISSEHGKAHVTKPSNGDMFRVHQQPEVIASDRDELPSLIFVIEYGSGFSSHDFNWRPMQTTIHGSRSSHYRYFSLEFQERRIPMGHCC
jgi:hypothetical protein